MQVNMQYHGRQVMLVYDLPMNEVVMDFFDKLKSNQPRLCFARLRIQRNTERAIWSSSTFWSNNEKVDALSLICPPCHQRLSRT